MDNPAAFSQKPEPPDPAIARVRVRLNEWQDGLGESHGLVEQLVAAVDAARKDG